MVPIDHMMSNFSMLSFSFGNLTTILSTRAYFLRLIQVPSLLEDELDFLYVSFRALDPDL
jgi:hypothetical protein